MSPREEKLGFTVREDHGSSDLTLTGNDEKEGKGHGKFHCSSTLKVQLDYLFSAVLSLCSVAGVSNQFALGSEGGSMELPISAGNLYL